MSVKKAAKPTREDTLKWFHDAKFGLVIHWGVYSLLGKGEWIQDVDKIPIEEYEKLYPKFNPTKFDPDTWADLAKQAGMKYVIVTTKHHDGFCLFDSAQTEYDIMSTPYGKDTIGMIAKSFRRKGLKVGFYHSIMDWHHPDYLPRRPWEVEQGIHSDKGAKFDRYQKYMAAQVKEILSNYGDIFALWWDGGWEVTAEQIKSAAIHKMARKLQPAIMINDRANIPEDLVTPEQNIPATGMTDADGNPLTWEACITMTSLWWGYDKAEKEYKTNEFIIRMLIDIVSKGGNLLLNIGPKPDGTIQKEFVDRLKAIGKWMAQFSEAIYGTTASPFNQLPFYGRATTKGNRLYLHVFEWPGDLQIRLPKLANNVKKAWLLAEGKPKLEAMRDGEDWVISLPGKPTDKIASVIAVDLDGEPQVEPFVIAPDDKGNIALPAIYAAIAGTHGQRIRYEMQDGVLQIGNWIRTPDTSTWSFEAKSGEYKLSLDYAVDAGEGGTDCVAVINGKEVPFKTTATGGEFKSKAISDIKLKKGMNTLEIRATTIKKTQIMNLRGASLKPIKKK